MQLLQYHCDITSVKSMVFTAGHGPDVPQLCKGLLVSKTIFWGFWALLHAQDGTTAFRYPHCLHPELFALM